ncbi:MAG: hypothetical protein OSJ73_26430 [Lachnospiraceae bacterium]|nr:hypothetical protein [Lachnospiraceae bacterium]
MQLSNIKDRFLYSNTIIKEPDAQTQSRQTCEESQLVGYFF